LTAVSVLGAGPYGLAVAAHLRAAGVNVHVFGDPMSFWAGSMPKGMFLRSPRVATSISDPYSAATLDRFTSATRIPVTSPVPLERFVEYGRWFQSTLVPFVDRRRVETVQTAGEGFRIVLADGEQLSADRVIIAAGIANFTHIPLPFSGLPRTLVSHTADHTDLSAFSGRRVLVVGRGQSALESGALLHERGASVLLVTRSPIIHWVNQHQWARSLGPISTALYAPPEVGPPLLCQLVRVPALVRALPAAIRSAIDKRSIRPSGIGWLRPRVDNAIPIRLGTTVTRARVKGERIIVTFDDGRAETFDHVLLGTGYRIDLARYPFLSQTLLPGVRQVNGYPVLGRGFQSSVPGLHFLGATSAWAFGPLMRFVAGTSFAAAEVTRHITSSARIKPKRAAIREK
jgi:cation diffusion facilitator CzcD-associated flavoprotein CzcO